MISMRTIKLFSLNWLINQDNIFEFFFRFALLKMKVFVLPAFKVRLFCLKQSAFLFKAPWYSACIFLNYFHVLVKVSPAYSIKFVFSWFASIVEQE